MPGGDAYTLEDAELDIGTLRGQLDRTSEVITKNDSTDPPNIPAAGIIHHSFGGHHKYASSDGGYYNTGSARLHTSGAGLVVSSTTQVNVTWSDGTTTRPVAAATYLVRGRLSATIGGTSTTIKLAIQGPATTSMEVGYWKAQNNPGGPTLFTATQTAINTLIQPFTVNEGNGNNFTILLEGVITFSAAGTIALAVAEAVNLQTWTLNANSTFVIEPAT